MNRVTFIRQAHRSSEFSPIDGLLQYFDHSMAAYELLNKINGITFHTTSNSGYSSFAIQIDISKDDLPNLENYININMRNYINIYDKPFHIYISRNDSGAELFVREIKIST